MLLGRQLIICLNKKDGLDKLIAPRYLSTPLPRRKVSTGKLRKNGFVSFPEQDSEARLWSQGKYSPNN